MAAAAALALAVGCGGVAEPEVEAVAGALEGDCTSCHGAPPASPHPQQTACGTCHMGYTATSVNVALHENGVVDVSGGSCTDCHGDAGRVGAPKEAPPIDTHGNFSTTARGVGAHLVHLSDGPISFAIQCTECHVVPTSPAHADGVVNVVFGTLATVNGQAPVWNGATLTCSSTYCHGGSLTGGTATSPVWTIVDGTQRSCGSCHGAPPPTAAHVGVPGGTSCGACHGVGYTSTSVFLATHLNGVIDVFAPPPPAPGAPTFPSVGTTSVTVSWASAAFASTYVLERALDAGGAPGAYAVVASGLPSTSYTDAGVAGGTTYWYRVRGTNTGGSGPYSPASAVTTLAPAPVPGAPGTPMFPAIGPTMVTVRWGTASGATAYAIERAPDVAGAPGAFAEIASGVTATSFTDAGLAPETVYWYRVLGTNAAGSGPYSPARSVRTFAALPGAPGAPMFSAIEQTTLTVHWGAASDATAYAIERAPDVAGAPGAFTLLAGGLADTSYADAGLAPGTRYWYRVRGTNTAGSGPYSPQGSVTTLVPAPGAPGAPVFSAVGQTTVTLSWSPGAFAATYVVERAPSASGPWSVVASGVASTAWTNAGLARRTTYWYRVQGVNAAGVGPTSAAASVKTK